MKPIRDFFYVNPSHIFHGMEKSHMDAMMACADECDFKPQKMLFRAGDAASHFFLIYIGEVALRIPGYTRGDSTVQTLTTGNVVGISWIMEPHQYRFDGVATEPTRTLRFDADQLREMFKSDYHLGYELMLRFTTTIARRLEAARLQMREMAREAE
jgi:CRP/FNR family cyclic AMP-dependent transcriptional regulator